MKKVIGIIDPCWVEYTDTSNLSKGRGGSETWTIQLSTEFQKRGYHVIVFCKVNEWHFNAFGTEWVPLNLLKSRVEYQKFDHIIISRKIGPIIDLIESSKCCDNVVYQAHDVWISTEDGQGPAVLPKMVLDNHPIIKAFLSLSESHEQFLQTQNKLPVQFIKRTGNGLIMDPFKNVDLNSKRSFNLFWSSRPERGLTLMINEILPRIRSKYPEARLRVASYDDIPIGSPYDNVDYLGRLSKEQLYKEMSDCRVWIYPAIFPETFCITALENIMCGCIPIVPHRDGMVTTFGPFHKIMTPNVVFETEENYDLVAQKALYYMEHYDDIVVSDLKSSLIEHVRSNYSWSNIVDKFEQIWTCL